MWRYPCEAQQEPLTQQPPQILQQQQELQRQLQGVQTPRRGAEDDSDQDDNGHGGRMMGSWHHRDWGRGAMGPGMMSRGGMMGPGSMGRGVMMRMMFSLMDADGDGAVSLQEFQAAHERIFKGMDANKMAVSPWKRSKASCRVPEDNSAPQCPQDRSLSLKVGPTVAERHVRVSLASA